MNQTTTGKKEEAMFIFIRLIWLADLNWTYIGAYRCSDKGFLYNLLHQKSITGTECGIKWHLAARLPIASNSIPVRSACRYKKLILKTRLLVRVIIHQGKHNSEYYTLTLLPLNPTHWTLKATRSGGVNKTFFWNQTQSKQSPWESERKVKWPHFHFFMTSFKNSAQGHYLQCVCGGILEWRGEDLLSPTVLKLFSVLLCNRNVRPGIQNIQTKSRPVHISYHLWLVQPVGGDPCLYQS